MFGSFGFGSADGVTETAKVSGWMLRVRTAGIRFTPEHLQLLSVRRASTEQSTSPAYRPLMSCDECRPLRLLASSSAARPTVLRFLSLQPETDNGLRCDWPGRTHFPSPHVFSVTISPSHNPCSFAQRHSGHDCTPAHAYLFTVSGQTIFSSTPWAITPPCQTPTRPRGLTRPRNGAHPRPKTAAQSPPRRKSESSCCTVNNLPPLPPHPLSITFNKSC